MSKTHVGFILDRSGSMGGIREATREGVIGYVKKLRKETPGALFSLTAFDFSQGVDLDKWVKAEPVKDVKITQVMEQYHPRGGTPLYDAIGSTVTDMEKKVGKDDKAVVIVMTDGYENASQSWTKEKVFALITKLSKKSNWTFVYLGANVDAYAESQAIGVAAGNVMSYSPSVASTGGAMAAAAVSTSQLLRSGKAQTSTFTADAGLDADYRDEDDK